MSAQPAHSQSAETSGDWLRPQLRWIRIPSWLLSAALHFTCLLLWIWLSQSEGCRGDIGVGDGEGYRNVGLIERPADDAGDDGEASRESGPVATESPSDTSPESASDAAQLVNESLSAPPSIGAADPTAGLPILGPGPPMVSSGASDSLLQPSRVGGSGIVGLPGSGGSDSGPGGGATSLFGVNDSGKRFVYVIDNSGSMESHDALQAAKNELQRSVEALGEEQQFLVIFYNVSLTVIGPRGEPLRMFHGTDVDRLDLSQQISSIEGDGGTDHVLALLEALEYHADVIFFLTDAGGPGLTTDEIEEITGRNGGASRIHCIEFGDSPEFAREDPSNSLRRLSEFNHGSYIYKDVRSFAR